MMAPLGVCLSESVNPSWYEIRAFILAFMIASEKVSKREKLLYFTKLLPALHELKISLTISQTPSCISSENNSLPHPYYAGAGTTKRLFKTPSAMLCAQTRFRLKACCRVMSVVE